jgi:diacylglycerol kinase family enzyme
MPSKENRAVEDHSGARPSVLRRASAVAALAALVLALGAVVVEFIWRPILLPVIALALILAVLAAWVSLVSRGARRWIATAISMAALIGLLAFVGVKTLAGAGLVLLLMVLSGLAARIAFGHDQGLIAPTPTVRRVGSARRGVLLMNPREGGGKVVQFKLADEARRMGVEPILLQQGDDLQDLARQAVSAGADVIGMAGGDGSQALVADVARSHDVAFVCVPAGTRNHLARDLGLDRDDVLGALQAFGEGVERRIDLATVSGRIFVNNASLGFYAAMVQSPAYRDSKLSTALDMLPNLMGPDAGEFDLQFHRLDSQRPESADVLLVSNNPYTFRTLAGPGSRPRLDSGVLGIVAARANRPRDLSALGTVDARGAIQQRQSLRRWTAPTFRVDSTGPVPVGLDGEALLLKPPLEFRTLPGVLRVRLPPASTGAPQIVVHGVRHTLGALLHIAAGHPAI